MRSEGVSDSWRGQPAIDRKRQPAQACARPGQTPRRPFPKNHEEKSMKTVAMMAAAVLGATLALPAMAQDPTKVDAKHYKVEFENDQVRVLRVNYGVKEKSVLHEHPDAVAIFMTDGKVKFTMPDGKTRDAVVKPGMTQFTHAGKHVPENMGDKPFEVILVELKGKPAAK
jgi:quercetin dioxygenase-like cupin family protein